MSSHDTDAPKPGELQLSPYIFFYGRCEEALNFYKQALGGTFSMDRNSESPMGADVAEDYKNKVMHSTFHASGLTFMASDGREAKPIDPDEGNITLAITAGDRESGERVFKALSDGGSVKMPFGDAPWGDGTFGVFDDRFGIEWMISAP